MPRTREYPLYIMLNEKEEKTLESKRRNCSRTRQIEIAVTTNQRKVSIYALSGKKY
jgi:hypothetical protein